MDPKKRVSSLKQYPVLAAFTLFFAALFVLDLVTPDRAYSELENTTLTQRPKLTAVSVDGLNNYFTNYTKYVKDQVFGRDQWISLQSLAETTLFQKTCWGGSTGCLPGATAFCPPKSGSGTRIWRRCSRWASVTPAR